VTLTDPVVRLVQESESGWNIVHLLKPSEQPPGQPEEPLPVSILIARLTVENGQVSVRMADGKEFQVAPVSLAGSLSLLPLDMRAEVDSLSFTLAGTGIPALQWNSSLAYEDSGGIQRVWLHAVDLRTALSHLQLAGSVDDLASPALALSAAVEKLAAADISKFLPEPRLQQDLSGTVEVNGPLSALQVKSSLTAPHGLLRTAITANLSQAPPDVHGTLQVERFVIDKMFHLPEVAGEVSGQVAFQGVSTETLRSELTASVTNLLVSGRQIGDPT
jgi:hypothetical protein